MSLNYGVIIVFAVFCVKQKNYFSKKCFIFLAFTICFHKYLMTVKLPKVRNNLHQEIDGD